MARAIDPNSTQVVVFCRRCEDVDIIESVDDFEAWVDDHDCVGEPAFMAGWVTAGSLDWREPRRE